MDIAYLLNATRSARKSLDLDAPVDIADVRECLRIDLQAANGSNAQSWKWLVVTDPDLREKIAELYRDAYLLRVGGQLLAHLVPPGECHGEPVRVMTDARCHVPAGADHHDPGAVVRLSCHRTDSPLGAGAA